MRKISRILGPFAALAILASAAACSKATTSKASQAIDDSAIHAQVKAKLTADRFSNIAIDINVTNGVVTLAGNVPTEEVKIEAGQEARSVDGVVRVVNNLRVEGAAAS